MKLITFPKPLLVDICSYKVPDGFKIVQQKNIYTENFVNSYELIFKLINEFKFYKVIYHIDPATGNMKFDNGDNCEEVEPHIEQVVVYRHID